MIEFKIKDATRFIVRRCDTWKKESPLYVLTVIYDNEKDENGRALRMEYDWNTLKYSIPRPRKVSQNIKPHSKDVIKKVFGKAGIECGKSNVELELPKEIWRNDLKNDIDKQIELIEISGYPRLGGLSRSNTQLLKEDEEIEIDFEISINGVVNNVENEDINEVKLLTENEVITIEKIKIEDQECEECIDLGFNMEDFSI